MSKKELERLSAIASHCAKRIAEENKLLQEKKGKAAVEEVAKVGKTIDNYASLQARVYQQMAIEAAWLDMLQTYRSNANKLRLVVGCTMERAVEVCALALGDMRKALNIIGYPRPNWNLSEDLSDEEFVAKYNQVLERFGVRELEIWDQLGGVFSDQTKERMERIASARKRPQEATDRIQEG